MRYLSIISKKVSIYSFSILLILATVIVVAQPNKAVAGTFGNTFVRFDRLQISQQTTGTVCAKPVTTATEASVQVVFPTGYTLGTAVNFTVSTTNLNWPTGGTAWPGIATATNVASSTVTFPSTDLTVGTLYCFNWTNAVAVQVKSSASSSNSGTVTTRDAVPATIDSASYSTQSLTSDQISVTATIPQAFTFALSGSSDALGNLSVGSVTSSATPRTATVNTNAAAGWIVWAKDANTGLNSPSTGYTVPATAPAGNASTITAGSEGYNLGVTSSQTGGTGTISIGAFDGSTASHGAGLDTTLRTIASSNGTANNAILTLKNNAGISSTTAAATDYTDAITVVGAGMF
ncbi:MAG TPA: hypothetical protein VMR45_02965 [Patescibacteria group bacterium]|nr:hypothetical protein [Patescibacteria group bacterium]